MLDTLRNLDDHHFTNLTDEQCSDADLFVEMGLGFWDRGVFRISRQRRSSYETALWLTGDASFSWH
jgi:hypothetical protein